MKLKKQLNLKKFQGKKITIKRMRIKLVEKKPKKDEITKKTLKIFQNKKKYQLKK
jgi:hypothetical protein